jgi:hypothetical protein
LEKLAEAAHARGPLEPAELPSFSIQMLNDVRLSDCTCPSVPTAKGRLELVRVELRGDLLTIADIRGQRRAAGSRPAEVIGARLYARRTICMADTTVFMFLSQLPPGVVDDKFFAAEGSVLMYANPHKGQRMLKACGIDRSSGQRLSWILEAVEA